MTDNRKCFLISLCWFYDLVGQYVWKYVCMLRLALFICIYGTTLWNLIKLCMKINIGYAVILRFHDFHLGGQTKVAYINICCKPSSFICISGCIFWNLTKLCMNVNKVYAVILDFHDFHLRGQASVAYVYKCFKTPFLDIQANISKCRVWRQCFMPSILEQTIFNRFSGKFGEFFKTILLRIMLKMMTHLLCLQ